MEHNCETIPQMLYKIRLNFAGVPKKLMQYTSSKIIWSTRSKKLLENLN